MNFLAFRGCCWNEYFWEMQHMSVQIRRLAVSGMAVAFALTFGLAPAAQAAAIPSPPSKALPASLDASTPSEPQVSCDPRSTQKAIAHSVTAWLSANNGAMARRFGINYIIWNRKIWGEYDPASGWAAYNGVVPHTDHVH